MVARFSGKVAVVTGAASGIGLAISKRMASEGANVVLVDTNEDALGSAEREVGAASGAYLSVHADVTNAAQVQGYCAAAIERFGGIDFLFNNAGILGRVGSFLEYEETEFDRILATNIKSVWLGMRAITPHLVKRGGGVIVNTASVAGLRGARGLLAYCATKHAVVGMTRSAAIELGTMKIRVNAICPGLIETPMLGLLSEGAAPGAPENFNQLVLSRVPMARFGSPDEVAAAAAFLCSADAAYVTAATYTIDGGMTF